jgi:hypothetical protein
MTISWSWKTIFSTSLIGAPWIGAFAGGADLRAASAWEDNTNSAFRKGFALASGQGFELIEVFRARRAPPATPDGAALALARALRSRSVSTVDLVPQSKSPLFARKASIPDSFSPCLPEQARAAT